jgi:hypothetical protein
MVEMMTRGGLTMNLQRFDPKARCPKCGGEIDGIDYIAEKAGPYLVCRCACGYAWHMAPLDAAPEVKPAPAHTCGECALWKSYCGDSNKRKPPMLWGGIACDKFALKPASELKACPFCGSVAILREDCNDGKVWRRAECAGKGGCGGMHPYTLWYDTQSDAIKAWNERAA